jgi:hypothetical protein
MTIAARIGDASPTSPSTATIAARSVAADGKGRDATSGRPPAVWTAAPAPAVGQHKEHRAYGVGLDVGATLLGGASLALGIVGLICAPLTAGTSLILTGAAAAGAGSLIAAPVLNTHWYAEDGSHLPQRSIVRDEAPGAAAASTQFQAADAMARGLKVHGSLWVEKADGTPLLSYAPQATNGTGVYFAPISGVTRAAGYAQALGNARSRALNGQSTAIEQLSNGEVWEQTIEADGNPGTPGKFGQLSLHSSDPTIKAVVTPSGVYT